MTGPCYCDSMRVVVMLVELNGSSWVNQGVVVATAAANGDISLIMSYVYN